MVTVKKMEVSRPECLPNAEIVSVKVVLDMDLTDLMPYLNATQKKTRYFPKGNFMRLDWNMRPVSIDGDTFRIAGFMNDKEAREGAEGFLGVLADVIKNKDNITPDHTPYDPPAVVDIFKLLPKKSGCAQCGHPSCMAFAAALVARDCEPESCKVFFEDSGSIGNLDKLREIL